MAETANRAFLYGESVFTTMRMINGFLVDWELHFDRLRKGVEFLYGPFLDADEWLPNLKNMLETRCHSESGDKVIRITVYRHQQSRGIMKSSLISVSDLKVHISSSPFDRDRFKGMKIKLRTCPTPVRPNWWPSYLKAGNYLEVILAQKVYLKSGDDDLLFLSNKDEVLESSVANIFVVRKNKLFTAPLGPNVLDGVMRKKILTVADKYFEEVTESYTDIDQLRKADAVFGSNSVRGLFLVDRIDDDELTYSEEFLNTFEALKKHVFE